MSVTGGTVTKKCAAGTDVIRRGRRLDDTVSRWTIASEFLVSSHSHPIVGSRRNHNGVVGDFSTSTMLPKLIGQNAASVSVR